MMKLLIITQAVDTEDPVLGFFVRWIEELSRRFESITVICLKMGKFNFPKNVRVYSLGKELGAVSRGTYAWRFLSLVWRLRHDYNVVFVHMNQEYILIAGLLWRLLGKRVYLWRNHYAGSWHTDIASVFCTKVFCTSKHSYTAKYKKAICMPVGVDTKRFHSDTSVSRVPRSILFFSRMSPSKRPEMLIDALALLAKDGVDFAADFYGSPLPQDERWYAGIQALARSLGLDDRARFHPEVPNDEAPNIFHEHEIFVNCSSSGMFDKTLFEAAACGCTVLAASDDFASLAGPEAHFRTADELAKRLIAVLASREPRPSTALVIDQSIEALGEKITCVLSSTT